MPDPSHSERSSPEWPFPTFVAGNKVYAVCGECGQMVRINKPILGSAHVCT